MELRIVAFADRALRGRIAYPIGSTERMASLRISMVRQEPLLHFACTLKLCLQVTIGIVLPNICQSCYIIRVNRATHAGQ